MAWKSNSFMVSVPKTSKTASHTPVSPNLRQAMEELSARADSYADTRRKRVESIKDVKLRESITK